MRALRSDGGRDGAAPVRADRLRWGFRDETVQQTASVRGIKTIVHLLARGRLTFLGHCIHGVICEIRTRFIRRTCGARALPSADVNTAQICARAYEREREREKNAKRRGFRKVTTTAVAMRRRDSEYDSTHAGPFGRPGSDPMHRRCGNIRRRNGGMTEASRASWTRRSRRSTWATLTRGSVPMQRDGGRPPRRLLRVFGTTTNVRVVRRGQKAAAK